MSNSEENPKQVFRLTDMSVEEVSVVDRAANRRKFLVVKREGDMAIGAKVTTNSDGTLTAALPPANTPSATESAPAAPTETEAAAKGISPEAKQAFSTVVEGALEGLAKAKQLLASGGSTEGVLDAVVKVADDLADSVFAFLGIEGDGSNAGLTAPADEPDAPAGMGKRLEVRRAKRVVAKDAGEKTANAIVAKYGAKMSKERLDRFQTALQVFQELLADVMPKVDTDKAKGEMSAGIAEQKPGEKPATQPTTAKKGIDPAAQKLLNQAAATIKKQAEQLGALRNTTQASNSAEVEVTKSRGQDVSWPLDMNDPVNEETSGKEFFG